jgi:hypothetical protein
MNKYLKYIKTVLVHKWYVFVECVKEGIIWQGIVHDLSKFSPTEFKASVKYWCDDHTMEDAINYQIAWLNHIHHNKHHWQNWVYYEDDTNEFYVLKIPEKYLKEMYCDLIGASKAYNKGKFDKKEPLRYFLNDNCSKLLCEDDKNYLIKKLEKLAE